MAILDFLFGQQGQAPQGNGLIDSRVAEAMANTQMPSPSPSAQAGGVLSQMSQGILSDTQGPGFMKRLGNALMAAGSRDPSQTLLELQKADNLATEAKKPKVQPLANGAFSLMTFPDGSSKVVRNEEVAKYLEDTKNREIEAWKTKFDYKVDNTPLPAAEQKLIDERKSAVSTLEGDIKNIQSTLDFGEQFKPGVGTQLAGTSIGRSIASLASGQSPDAANAARMQQQIQKVLATDWVKATEPLKGALSDREGARLAATQPLPTDDYETVIKPWMKSLQAWLNDGLAKAKQRAEADTRTPSTSTRDKPDAAPKAAPAASINPDQVKSAFGTYEPDVYEYRISNGTVQRRKK